MQVCAGCEYVRFCAGCGPKAWLEGHKEVCRQPITFYHCFNDELKDLPEVGIYTLASGIFFPVESNELVPQSTRIHMSV
jgi:hypothetical protein